MIRSTAKMGESNWPLAEGLRPETVTMLTLKISYAKHEFPSGGTSDIDDRPKRYRVERLR